MGTNSKPEDVDPPAEKQGVAHELAVAAYLSWWKSVIRKRIKVRTHRPTTDAQVLAKSKSIGIREVLGRWSQVSRSVARALESRLGKPYSQWTTEERGLPSIIIAEFFNQMQSDLERGRGRPRKATKKKPQGIMARATRNTNERDPTKVLRPKIIAIAAGAKLATFIKSEEEQSLREGQNETTVTAKFGTIQSAKKYARSDMVELEDILSVRSNAKAARIFIAEFGLDQRLEARLKKFLSRNAKAIEAFLQKKLED